MSKLKEQFERAADEVKKLSARPDDEMLLKLYALYKQSVAGDVEGERPGMFNLVGRAKFDAWAKLKGQDRQQSMRSYIALVDELKNG